MAEARDRLSRPEDIAAIFSHQRRLIAAGGILTDEPGASNTVPFRSGASVLMGTHANMGVPTVRAGFGSGTGRGSFVRPRPRYARGRGLYGSPAFAGSQNISLEGSGRRGRGRSTNSVLPSWYPRTPLGDITAIVRAIERRRARLRQIEGQGIESPILQDQIELDHSLPLADAQLEHSFLVNTPDATIGSKLVQPSVGKVPKILLDITNQHGEKSDFLTPQKRLLNSIDKVEKVVMDELQKLKSTPSAKRSEREKRVHTLMSMR